MFDEQLNMNGSIPYDITVITSKLINFQSHKLQVNNSFDTASNHH